MKRPPLTAAMAPLTRWTPPLALAAFVLASGCAHELRGKATKSSHRHDEEEEEEDETSNPGSLRRSMHQKAVKEPDPFNWNKIFKDERTQEIERNLGIES